MRANVVVLNDRARELIARYPVTLKCDLATDNPNIAPAQCERRGGGHPRRCTRSRHSADGERRTENCFRLGRSAGAVSADYGKRAGILPRSLSGKLGNVAVNGQIITWPDGAVQLKNTAALDSTFALAGQTGPVLGGPLCCDAGPRAGCRCPGKAGRAVRYAQGNFGPKPCHTGRPAV